MTHSNTDGGRESRAALFVDYESIYKSLSTSLDGQGKPDELIAEMIDALQRSLLEERKTRTVVARAYADFSALDGAGDHVQRSLYSRGVEPLLVPRTPDTSTAELQLCVDSMDLLHHRSDISMFVLLTGRRTYPPLVQVFKRYGQRVLVVGTDDPHSAEEKPHLGVETFFPARDLLSAQSRRAFTSTDEEASDIFATWEQDGRHMPIEDPDMIRALQIIEQHFGQYDEVYLTPLLRKMSDLMNEEECDPKAIISELENHAAVRLEKRQGEPHDYTVLILVETHPDVVRVRDDLRTAAAFRQDGRDAAYAENLSGEKAQKN